FVSSLPTLRAAPPTPLFPRSLHDALPICPSSARVMRCSLRSSALSPALHWAPIWPCRPPCWPSMLPSTAVLGNMLGQQGGRHGQDRKSTRLNSSHVKISYAVFCLKKKNTR